jgi:hypothetical protein
MAEYKKYRRNNIAEMADWVPDFDMANVSISQADLNSGSPKLGDKIARNPNDHEDRWLVAERYFLENFEMIYEPKQMRCRFSKAGEVCTLPNVHCSAPECMVEI